jgi:FkbM family methyltransferase
MLMDLDELAAKYNLQSKVRGIFHGGAHLAEESGDYDRVFPDVPVWWVEANPSVFVTILGVLAPYPRQRLMHALLYDRDNELVTFNVTNYDGMSSSILEFGTHPEFSPDTVFVDKIEVNTRTIDSIVKEHKIDANMLVLDIQGAEGLALAGAVDLLPKLDFVMLEVNKEEVYVGCTKVWDLDDVLLANGLTRVETFWVGEQGWGDAAWVRQ